MTDLPDTPRTVLYLDHTAKWSGGEIALLRTVEELDRRLWTPLVVLAEDGPFAERLRDALIETVVLPLGGNVREVRKDALGIGGMARHGGGALAALVRYAEQIARIARTRDAALIHCNSLKSDLYGALAGKLAGRPVLWHVRDHIAAPYLPGPAVVGFRRLARSVPQMAVVNSESTRDTLLTGLSGIARARMEAKTRVVYDGLSVRDLALSAGTETRNDAWRGATPRRIGIVGRITPWKGQRVFLDAAALLLAEQTYPLPVAVEFVVIGAPLFGENDYDAELKAFAGKSPLQGHVTFTGFRNDVRAVLQDLDILVHASVSPEPFGQVVIEGMAEGLPVIGADAGGVREIIRHNENGLLAPPGDAPALARAIRTLLTDEALARRLAQAAHADVRARFTAVQSARSVEAAYRDILTPAPPVRAKASS